MSETCPCCTSRPCPTGRSTAGAGMAASSMDCSVCSSGFVKVVGGYLGDAAFLFDFTMKSLRSSASFDSIIAGLAHSPRDVAGSCVSVTVLLLCIILPLVFLMAAAAATGFLVLYPVSLLYWHFSKVSKFLQSPLLLADIQRRRYCFDLLASAPPSPPPAFSSTDPPSPRRRCAAAV